MLEDIINDRKKKLEKWKRFYSPYPSKVRKDISLGEIRNNFSFYLDKQKKIFTAGRIMSVRDQGKIIFCDLEDYSGRLQIIFNANETAEFSLLKETIDVGDFVSVNGVAFQTKKGEKSLIAKKALIISKSLRPIPKEWYGIEDTETRLRKRYLETILNPEVRNIFVKKSVFWKTVRDFLTENGFLEVENNVLENVPGGAEAEPFVTHMNALDEDFYLRISLELPLKKMLVGGFEKIFEIGRIFRNEGIDKEHLQDYMQMEVYWAYTDYNDMMKLTQKMYRKIVKNVCGSLKTKWNNQIINWGGKWPKLEYFELFKKYAGVDLMRADMDVLRSKAKSLGLEFEPSAGKGRLIDLIYKKTVRPNLIQPSFLVNPPVEIEPLAKRMESCDKKVERFQIMAMGTELGKGFSELNDPIDQNNRFIEQAELRKRGDREAQMMNEDFVEALQYGMPPASGFGMSERFFAFLLDLPVREAQYFPLMRKK